MDKTVREIGGPDFTVSALIARWNAPTSRLAWISCGGPPLIVASADGTTQQLEHQTEEPAGILAAPGRAPTSRATPAPRAALILCSDGASIRPDARDGDSGLTDISGAIVATRDASAAATVRQILDVIAGESPDGPKDDVAVITLRIS